MKNGNTHSFKACKTFTVKLGLRPPESCQCKQSAGAGKGGVVPWGSVKQQSNEPSVWSEERHLKVADHGRPLPSPLGLRKTPSCGLSNGFPPGDGGDGSEPPKPLESFIFCSLCSKESSTNGSRGLPRLPLQLLMQILHHKALHLI